MKISRFLLAVAASALFVSPAFACSGDGAGDAILLSVLLGWGGLLVTTIAFVMFARSRRMRDRRRLARFGVGLAIPVHPAVWMSALSGDCGYTLRYASIAWTTLAVLAMVALYVVAGRARVKA